VPSPLGTTVTYSLSEDASVRFTIERKPAKRQRRRRRARQRLVRLPDGFTHSGRTGENSFRFSGRLTGRKLAPGSYVLVAVATDPDGNASPPERAAFKILKPPKR
jgi:hypothetical protein